MTPRLVLRPVGVQDKAAVVEGLGDLAVSGWLSVVPHPYTPGDFDSFLADFAHPGATWTIEESGAFCGILGLESATLGYWLLPGAQGRGLATEAAGAALQAHFAAGGGPVASGYFEGNARSARVLGKLGFVEIARDKKFCRPMGVERPHVTLQLTEAAFRSSSFILT